MTDEDFDQLFAGVRDFGWDPRKRETTLRDRKIDLDDAREVFSDYTFIRRSDRHGEIRYQVFGYVKGREVAVICTLRSSLCRIISARRANRAERRKYYDSLSRQSESGKN